MEESIKKKKVTLEERLYKTPMVYVISLSAAAALALCVLTAVVMLILGFGFSTTVLDNGVEIRYFGIMRDGTPAFGWLRDSEGKKGFISGDRVKYSDGSRYDGDTVGFYYDGEGRYTDSDGNIYIGSFSRGLLQGKVHIDYADGGSFDGTYLDGKKSGFGRETHPGEITWGYSGEYAEGEKNGYGEFTYPDGSVYKGNFRNGMRHGSGSYRFASGDSYTGEFRYNVITGAGTYFFASGRVYSGEFAGGLPLIG